MISVSHLTVLDVPPEELIDRAAAAGFGGVGLRINPPKHTPDRWPVVGDPPRIAALRRRAQDRNIRIFEAESFIMDADVDLDALRRALDVAGELGVSCLVSAGGDPDESRMVDNYAALAAAAVPYGITVGMEFMAFRAMRSLGDATRVWRRVAHPNAQILIDALHLDRSGGSPADVAKLDPAAVGYVQVCDAPAYKPGTDLVHEARTGRCYPGDGVLPLDALFDALPADVPVSLEAPVSADDKLPNSERLKRAGDKTLGFFVRRGRKG